ncbi:hypothetical protein PG996_004276 [Apiospora saccharicola]|uniref:DUF7580 domain-containing protein n=1 Tax=Apiospora saccharicola TaxID=335842 RepID=A0ABR1W3M4_9PEZI
MAELGLAIAPLCIGAIKSTALVHEKLKVLRHHKREIRRLQKKFSAQTDIFRDECQMVLEDTLGDHDMTKALMKESDNPMWNTKQLDDQINSYLGPRAIRYRDTVKDIREYISELDKLLNALTGEDQHPDVKIKASESKEEAISIMFNKSKCESLIEEFKDSNHVLKHIQKMSARRKNPAAAAPSQRATPIGSLPSSYRLLARHSDLFHGALGKFWSCLQMHHTSHDACILLDSRQDGSFRVVVRYQAHHGTRQYLDDLLICPETLEGVHKSIPRALLQKDGHISQSQKGKGVGRTKEDPSRRLFKLAKREKSTQASASTRADRSSSECMCNQIRTQTMSARYAGYIDSPGEVRHHMYPVCDEYCDQHKDCLNENILGEPVTLDEAFGYPVEECMSVPQQLRLALKLINGVLQLASTPWLRELWSLKDVFYFQRADDIATALKTLHIRSELSNQGWRVTDTTNLAVADELLNAKRTHGVGNATLYSLGKALLQVGKWSPLTSEDIGEIRRLAESNSRLGPAYDRITQQCLDCNFASSKDLHDPNLQNAIYRDVVCGLEGIINCLEGR